MMKLKETTGEITCYIGDSGKFYLSGLPASCKVYFSVYDEKYRILNEKEYTATAQGTLKMFIPAEFTDVLTIPKNEDYKQYYYSIKIVYFDEDENRVESTCILANHNIDEPNLFTVYAKRTEGGKTENVEDSDE